MTASGQFPDLMAIALKRGDLWEWAAARDIALIRPVERPSETSETVSL